MTKSIYFSHQNFIIAIIYPSKDNIVFVHNACNFSCCCSVLQRREENVGFEFGVLRTVPPWRWIIKKLHSVFINQMKNLSRPPRSVTLWWLHHCSSHQSSKSKFWRYFLWFSITDHDIPTLNTKQIFSASASRNSYFMNF